MIETRRQRTEREPVLSRVADADLAAALAELREAVKDSSTVFSLSLASQAKLGSENEPRIRSRSTWAARRHARRAVFRHCYARRFCLRSQSKIDHHRRAVAFGG
jgi:hypothetical protein